MTNLDMQSRLDYLEAFLDKTAGTSAHLERHETRWLITTLRSSLLREEKLKGHAEAMYQELKREVEG